MKTDEHFFSYSRKDASDFVLKLASDLKANGFNIWLDQQDIAPGTVWDTEIQKALNAATCVIIVLSAASVSSPNVLDEMSYALKLGKRIYPVLIDDCDIPFRIDRIQRIDFRHDYNAGLTELIKNLDQTSTAPVITTATNRFRKIAPIAAAAVAVLCVLLWLLTNHRNAKRGPDTIDTTAIMQADSNAGKLTAKDQEETQLFAEGDLQASYRINNGQLILIIHSPDNVPAVYFDVNLNKAIDDHLDRAYGITRGTINAICPQLLLTANGSTPCGGAASEASLSLRDNVYTYNIPLSEISVAPGKAIAFQLAFYNYDSGWVRYPGKTTSTDFKQVYTVAL